MKVLMFGWEFPPIKSGGLGTACKDLTKGLSRNDVDVLFVMPFVPEGMRDEHVKLIGTNNLSKNIRFKTVNTILQPYQSYDAYGSAVNSVMANSNTKGQREVYGKDIFNEVERYAAAARLIAEDEDFDVIHVHDWMTYKAGLIAKHVSGKPLVAHIHATEFDRTGGNPNSFISHREYEGLEGADIIIANSNFTKDNVVSAYNIDPNKIEVVHWGIDEENPEFYKDYRSDKMFTDDEKVVLFLGRVTLQKGPEYFIDTAKIVKEYIPNAKFVVAGNGDMLPRMIEKAAYMNLVNDVVFTGFLQGSQVHRAFQSADLYVMPSVSEPFGLVALESLRNKTPVLLSKQSGVSEVVKNAFKSDFWDTHDMANKIIATLKYQELHEELRDNSYIEAQGFNLDMPAKKTIDVYNKSINLCE